MSGIPAWSPNDFDEFWELTPPERKVDKKRARQEYERARLIASKQTIHDNYERYWRETADRPTHYKKHPSTWLHGENWDDAPQQIVAEVSARDRRIADARAALVNAALSRAVH